MALTAPSAVLTGSTIASSFDQLLFVDAAAGMTEATLKIVSTEVGKSALQISDEHVLIKGVDTNNAAGFEVQQTDGTSILKVAAGTPSVLVSGNGTKLYFADAGGEYISGSASTSDLTITAGNDIKLAVGAAGSVHSSGSAGTSNTVLGVDAGAILHSGSDFNVFIGDTAADATMTATADYNVGVGYGALGALTQGTQNVIVGASAGAALETGNNNVAVGMESFQDATSQSFCVVIGKKAGADINSDDANGTVAIGYTALAALTSGQKNTAIGYQSGTALTTADNNVAIGYNAFYRASTAADDNVVIGYNAMSGNFTTADIDDCVIIGSGAAAGTLTADAYGTVAIGKSALAALTSGEFNVAVGYEALKANTDGDQNTALGFRALLTWDADTAGEGQNVAIGYLASTLVPGSERSVVIGANALDAETGAGSDDNTVVGANALGNLNNASNNDNVAIGSAAGASGGGANLTQASDCVFIGRTTGASAASSVSNQTVIGYDAQGQGNNTVTLGDGNVTDVYMSDAKTAMIHGYGLQVDPNNANTSGNIIYVQTNSTTTGCAARFVHDGTTLASTANGGFVEIASTGDIDGANNLLHINNANAASDTTVPLWINQAGNTRCANFEATDASYGDIMLFLNATARSSNSAFNFLRTITSGEDPDDIQHYLRGDGEAYADASWNASGADYAEYFESKDGSKIAVGTTVKLDGDKIVVCESGDSPLGVVRPQGCSSNIGNAAGVKWQGKYLKDDYGSYIKEEYTVTEWIVTDSDGDNKDIKYQTDKIPSDVTVPNDATVTSTEKDGSKLMRKKLNPDFVENVDEDGSQIYSPREERDEWHIVGLLGQIPITKGQPMADNWIKMKDVSDTVEMYLVK